MISVLSAVAEIERENILVQTMEGRKQKAREGKWNGGFAPYGYELIDGELKIAEDEAEIIRIIYDKFIHTTMGAGTVAKYLNRQGYIKKKRQNGTLDAFTAHFVKLVLDNPIYCGKIAFGRRKTEKIQGTAAKERLGSQIDRLDCSDRHYEQKYTDMQNRINSLYDEIAEATENLETVQTQIKAIKEQKISRKRIFEFLELFDIIYNKFTEFEKKEFLHSFIKKIEIYPEPLENGQILKSIQFRFPVYYQGNEADMFIPNFENTVETVVLLSRA